MNCKEKQRQRNIYNDKKLREKEISKKEKPEPKTVANL